VQVRADPGDHLVQLGPRGHLVDPGRAAVGGEARADRLVGREQRADAGVQAVGGDQRRAPVASAVGAFGGGGVVVAGHGADVLARLQPDPGGQAGVVQDGEQVAAVHDHVRRPVPGAERLAQVQGGQLVRGQRAAQQQPARLHARLEHPAEHAQAGQHPGGVRRELKAGAQLGELRRLLQHPDPVPVPGQRKGGGQPADAPAHDQDVRLHRSPPKIRG
jgi:hypothetical protein